jgi:hypothetical protein
MTPSHKTRPTASSFVFMNLLSLLKITEIMTYVLKQGQCIDDILKQIEKDKEKMPKPKHDFSKYVGKIKFDKDPLEIQKEMRDEWE